MQPPMTKFPFILLVLFFIACNQQPTLQSRDLIINKYLQAMDSLPCVDTTGEDFMLLKAYHNNDTNYLKKSYAEIADILKSSSQIWKPLPCEDTIPINKKNFDEAYTFSYEAAFCPTSAIMTIGKRTDSIILDLYLYDFQDQTRNLTSHTTKLLTKQDWEALTEGIFYCNFWGLKDFDDRHGFDGSTLYIKGYKKGINSFNDKHKTIRRWAAEEMAIGHLFKKCFDLSDTAVGCFRFPEK